MATLPKLFFLNNKLYKSIKEIKSEDYVRVYDFEQECMGVLSLSYTRRNLSKAFLIEDVSKLLRIPVTKIKSLIDRNIVSYPSGRAYNQKTKRPLQWYWSEQDVFDLRDVLYDMAPKDKNGDLYANVKLVGKAELRAAILGDAGYFVKSQDGELIKVWRAVE